MHLQVCNSNLTTTGPRQTLRAVEQCQSNRRNGATTRLESQSTCYRIATLFSHMPTQVLWTACQSEACECYDSAIQYTISRLALFQPAANNCCNRSDCKGHNIADTYRCLWRSGCISPVHQAVLTANTHCTEPAAIPEESQTTLALNLITATAVNKRRLRNLTVGNKHAVHRQVQDRYQT